MRRLRKPIGLTACFCLLAVQWSGMHRHADETGTIGAPEIAASHTHFHIHDHAAEHGGLTHPADVAHVPGSPEAAAHSHEHEHEHEDEREVSVFDLAAGSAKLPVGILALIAPFLPPPSAAQPIRAAGELAVPVGQHVRWRPPLRAPPLPA